MEDLVYLYHKYVTKPCIEDFVAFFGAVVESKDDVSEQLMEHYFNAVPVYDNEHKHLISNGTSSMRDEDREYWFGPLFNPVRKIVEKFLRTRSLDPYIKFVVTTNFPTSKEELVEPGRMRVDISDPNYGYRLIETIESQKVNGTCFCFYSFPSNIHSIGYMPYLLDYLSKQENFIITSSNREAFFNNDPFSNKGIVINDHMVNWRSGVSFYTCKHGKKHALRNLYGIRNGRYHNLMNINCKEGTPIDDLIEFSPEKCTCGRSFLIKSLIPHYEFCPVRDDGSYVYDLSLAGKILQQWYTIQFLGDGKYLDCHYTSEDELNKDFLESQLQTKINLVPNSSFIVGANKGFVFWNRPDLIKILSWTK